jgi:micrococcal nuclease
VNPLLAAAREEISLLEPALPDLDFADMDFFDDGYEQVKYIRTTDGDTASFEMDGLNVKCRFVGIDTPEIDWNGGDHEPYAEDASSYTEKVLESAEVIILERDQQAGEHDRYDRLLAHVWADGKLLGWSLILNGIATTRYYHEDYKYYEEISAAENWAEENGIGQWGE